VNNAARTADGFACTSPASVNVASRLAPLTSITSGSGR
jgi:hypothetical protein